MTALDLPFTARTFPGAVTQIAGMEWLPVCACPELTGKWPRGLSCCLRERVGLSRVALKFFKMSQVQKANILFVQQCNGQRYPPTGQGLSAAEPAGAYPAARKPRAEKQLAQAVCAFQPCFEWLLTHLLVTSGPWLNFRTPLCPCEVDTCKVRVRILGSLVIALAMFNVTDIVFTGMKLLASVT